MLKVCIVTTVHPLFDVRVFYREAQTLLRHNFDVHLIVQHPRDEIKEGIKIIALPIPKNRFERFISGRSAYKLALKCKADVYHFHDPELIPWMLRLKKKTGAKIIYDVHENVKKDIMSKTWIPGLLRGLVSCLFDWYEKRAAKKMDYIIAATPSIAMEFRQSNVILVSNYPILSDKVNGLKDHRDQQLNLIYIGALTRIKGIKEIIQAVRQINIKHQVCLRLAGSFSEKDFEQEISPLIDNYRVKLLGQLSQQDMRQELRRADIGLVCFWPEPNHIDAMPNKIFEYMAAGLTIIASNFPLWQEIIVGGHCGLVVDPLNPQDIAKAIQYLINNSNERRLMGERGQQLTREKYNWDREAIKLLEVYQNL